MLLKIVLVKSVEDKLLRLLLLDLSWRGSGVCGKLLLLIFIRFLSDLSLGLVSGWLRSWSDHGFESAVLQLLLSFDLLQFLVLVRLLSSLYQVVEKVISLWLSSIIWGRLLSWLAVLSVVGVQLIVFSIVLLQVARVLKICSGWHRRLESAVFEIIE